MKSWCEDSHIQNHQTRQGILGNGLLASFLWEVKDGFKICNSGRLYREAILPKLEHLWDLQVTVDCAPSVSVALADSFMAEDFRSDWSQYEMYLNLAGGFVHILETINPENWGRCAYFLNSGWLKPPTSQPLECTKSEDWGRRLSVLLVPWIPWIWTDRIVTGWEVKNSVTVGWWMMDYYIMIIVL